MDISTDKKNISTGDALDSNINSFCLGELELNETYTVGEKPNFNFDNLQDKTSD